MSRGKESFPKAAHLTRRSEFLSLSRGGRRVHTSHFVVISKANNKGQSRLGITVSGKVGNSVVRNRIKRQVREFFRRHRADLPMATDFLIIARSGAASLVGQLITSELERAMLPRRAQCPS